MQQVKIFFIQLLPFSPQKVSQKDIKENVKIITNTQNVSLYLLIFFSPIASHIGQDDHIDTSQENYLSYILMKHANYKSILAIKENHSDQMTLNIRKV